MRRGLVLAIGVLLAWGEWENWRSSRSLAAAPRGGSEAVVVLGFRNRGSTPNAVNRWRVRAGLRSIGPAASQSRLVVCGGSLVDGQPTEAALMSAYARHCGYSGEILLDEKSLSTWENVTNMIPLVEDADQIKVVSNTMHALKARLYLVRQRPDLALRLTRGGDYRLGEWLPLKPLLAAHGRWTLRTIDMTGLAQYGGNPSFGNEIARRSPGQRTQTESGMTESTNLTADEQAELANPEIEAPDDDAEPEYEGEPESRTDEADGFIEDDSGYLEDVDDIDGVAEIPDDDPVDDAELGGQAPTGTELQS